MIIHVTQKHIREGRCLIKTYQGQDSYAECKICPVALAIHEQTGMTTVRVYGDEIVDGMFVDPDAPRAFNPRSVARFVKAFDAGKKVKPFRFRLVWK